MDNNFKEYKLKILGDLERQNQTLLKIQDVVSLLTVEVGQLKTIERMHSIFYGGLGGVISAVIAIIMFARSLS